MYFHLGPAYACVYMMPSVIGKPQNATVDSSRGENISEWFGFNSQCWNLSNLANSHSENPTSPPFSSSSSSLLEQGEIYKKKCDQIYRGLTPFLTVKQVNLRPIKQR